MQATVQQPQRAPDGTPVHYERHRPERTKLVTPVLQVVHRVITRHLLGQASGNVEGADEADSGAVTLIQRFGAAANLNSQKVLTVQGGLQGMPRETDFKQTLTVSACTPPCAAVPTTGRRWSNCAASSATASASTAPHR